MQPLSPLSPAHLGPRPVASAQARPVERDNRPDRVELGGHSSPPAAQPPVSLQPSEDLAQVQVLLDGKPLMASTRDLGFLGPEAARTIGNGARWKHPFPQDWPWPPREPKSLAVERNNGQTTARVTDADFIAFYGARTALTTGMGARGETRLVADLDNLSSKAQSPWIVAPLATPAGSTLDDPSSMAVFPLVEPAELLQLHCRPGSQAEKAWDYQADSGLMFVSPGARLDEDQAKGLFSDRWSMFGRKGDSAVLLCQAKGAADGFGFQVYAGIGNYLELEWVGQAADTGQHSRVEVVLEPLELADLHLECDGQPLLTLGCTGAGLKKELALVAAALRQRMPAGPAQKPDDSPGWLTR